MFFSALKLEVAGEKAKLSCLDLTSITLFCFISIISKFVFYQFVRTSVLHSCIHSFGNIIMSIAVTTFCNETEALSAFSSNPQSFQVAIVEVLNLNEAITPFSYFQRNLTCFFGALILVSWFGTSQWKKNPLCSLVEPFSRKCVLS